jgi:hypothetical protein
LEGIKAAIGSLWQGSTKELCTAYNYYFSLSALDPIHLFLPKKKKKRKRWMMPNTHFDAAHLHTLEIGPGHTR